MEGNERGRGDGRAQYSPEVIDLIRQEVSQMNKDETVRRVQFGHQEEGGVVWVARAADLIVDPEKIKVDGVDYYFGLFKSEGAE